MKKYIYTLVLIGFALTGYSQQWVDNMSCNKKASEIVNQAITHLANLEHLMAVLTFYAKGSFTLNESKEEVDYSTRASAVWIATNTGWKMVHTNYSPFGGAGIPQ